MGATLLIAAALLAQASPPCDEDAGLTLDRWDLVDEVKDAIIAVDFAAGREALLQLEASFGCGPVAEPALLGQMWLLEGALASFEGDPHGAQLFWAAAARVAPGRWIEDLGIQLRTSYEEALTAPTPDSQVRIAPDLPPGWVLSIDGRPSPTPTTVPAGLHLVQLGPDTQTTHIARVLLTDPTAPSVVQVDLDFFMDALDQVAEAPPPAPELPAAPPAREPIRARPWLAIGPVAALGRPLISPSHGEEPGVKVVIPAELGLVVAGGSWWVRGAGSAGPLLGGRFLYAQNDEVHASLFALGGHVAAGIRAPGVEPGLLAGISWPGRVVLHGVLGLHPENSPVRVELRVGAHLASERLPEPAGGLALSLPL